MLALGVPQVVQHLLLILFADHLQVIVLLSSVAVVLPRQEPAPEHAEQECIEHDFENYPPNTHQVHLSLKILLKLLEFSFFPAVSLLFLLLILLEVICFPLICTESLPHELFVRVLSITL